VSRGEDVAVSVVAFVFALEVVGVEVAVGLEGAKLQDGFGDLDALAGAGDVHAVFDQVAPGASMTPVEMGYPAARA
jgi:hypothetical protein